MGKNSTSEQVDQGPPWWRSTRFFIAYMGGFAYANIFFQRVNIGMAMICMVNHTAVDLIQGHHSPQQQLSHAYNSSQRAAYTIDISAAANASLAGGCKASHEENLHKEDGELVWTKSTQGIVLGGLYWGYLLLQLPAQRIMEYFSCKKVAFSTILLMSLLTIVIPVASDVSPWLVMAIRVVQGLTSALSVPAIYCVWAEWGPPLERATMVTICYSGLMIANAVVYPTSGLLCQYGFAGGWPSVFYVYGILGVVWCIMWQVIFYETPEEHPRIDPREREYIVQSIAKAHGAQKGGAIPWGKLLTSLPVWAVILGNVGFNFPFFMLLAVLPQYMKEILQFDIKSNGFYSMLPFIMLFVITNVYRPICGVLREKRILSVTAIRKVSAVLGTFVPGVLYVIISFLDCDYAMVVVVLMSFAIGFSGANMQGYYINPYDIAPQYATAILCLGNTASVATGIVSPYIVAALTVDKTREEWQQVYFLTAGIVTACMVFYLVFGSGTQLEWTKTKQLDMEMDIDAKEPLNKTNNDSSKNNSNNNRSV